MSKSRWVLLRRVDRYDTEKMSAVVNEGFELLGRRPQGRVLIKPNVVFANKNYSQHAFTHPELVGVVADKVRSFPGITDLSIGESGGYAIPTRLNFKESGYYDMGRRHGVPIVDFNEDRYEKVTLKKGKFHKTLLCPRLIHDADFKIWMPKLKYHICCEITNALKLNIGSLLHKERMLFHDDRLNDKIVDVLEIGYPDMVISDAVIIGHGFESCAKPFHLGLIMISNDPIAADTVAAQILGYRPEQVNHLRIASERGYGSIDPDSVSVLGDVTVEELAAKTSGIVSQFQDMQKLDTRIRFYEGIGPNTNQICYGGCMAAVKGSLGTIDARRPGSLKNAKEGAIVTGIYDGDVDAGNGLCLLIGDCTEVRGKIRAGKIKRVKGCPIGAVQLTSVLPMAFGMPSPLFDVRDVPLVVLNSIVKFVNKAWHRAF
ncbi:MAG: DUF362 domain-containing protein [Bacteriovoracaceae bacterium]|nr:DUF362 domain-containing protein [Bacteriovoracaceae bacterium]HRR22096.1 DUF362 domain-containing protein [Desulfomonilia bacterium]HRT45330.1 DUF362 domain-containing protein [Desulfomonilia bacterium]